MDGWQVVTSVVSSSAWPLAVVWCVWLLRRQLTGLIDRVQVLELGENRLTFQSLNLLEGAVAAATVATPVGVSPEAVRSVQSDGGWTKLMSDAARDPRRAIVDAWGQLESQLNAASDRLDPAVSHTWPQVARNLQVWPEWSALQPSVLELRHLREVAISARRDPSASDGVRYVSLAKRLAEALQTVQPGRPAPDAAC